MHLLCQSMHLYRYLPWASCPAGAGVTGSALFWRSWSWFSWALVFLFTHMCRLLHCYLLTLCCDMSKRIPVALDRTRVFRQRTVKLKKKRQNPQRFQKVEKHRSYCGMEPRIQEPRKVFPLQRPVVNKALTFFKAPRVSGKAARISHHWQERKSP